MFKFEEYFSELHPDLLEYYKSLSPEFPTFIIPYIETSTMQRLKGIEGFNVPTVVLTANAIVGMKEKYLNAGFDDYLSKPIDRNELNRVINDFLSKK